MVFVNLFFVSKRNRENIENTFGYKIGNTKFRE